MNNENTSRPLSTIACEIAHDWKKVNFAAKPYLSAMYSLNTVDDNYYFDSGKEIVIRFLCNANTWRGEVAKRVKAELKKMVGLK